MQVRNYDTELLRSIRKRQYMEKKYELEILVKPISIPSENRHVDPFIEENIKRKKSSGTFSLHNERHRQDKKTQDLIQSLVVVEEKVIHFETHSINSFLFIPQDICRETLIIFFHGGGYIAGSIEYYYNQCKFLAEQSQARVLFPEYRLAPENPFPCGIEDGQLIVDWVKNNYKFERLVLIGDSAGAGIINALLYEEKNKNTEKRVIDFVVELYPASDMFQLENTPSSWELDQYPAIDYEEKFIIDRITKFKNSTEIQKNYYVRNKVELTNPFLSSNYWENYQNLPPMMVISAEFDFFRPSNEIFVEHCLVAGNEIDYINYRGCDHGFLDYFGAVPQAEEVLLTIAEKIVSL